jgi:hypothetical protein
MLQEIKEFLRSPLTKSMTVDNIYDEEFCHAITYTLTNGAMNMQFQYSKVHKFNETYIDIYTQTTKEMQEVRNMLDTTWYKYTRIENLKDIKDILNTLKTKFFPNL